MDNILNNKKQKLEKENKNNINKKTENIFYYITFILLIVSCSPVLLVIIETSIEMYIVGKNINLIPDIVYDTLSCLSPIIFLINTIILSIGKIKMPKSKKISVVFYMNLGIIIFVIAVLLYIQWACSGLSSCN